MLMTAAVLRDTQAPYELEQVELSGPAAGELLVRIVGAGFCHTDVLPRKPGFGAAPPIILGHEGAGVVEAVGPEVTEFAPGDHVVLSYDSCHECDNCRAGNNAYCLQFFPRNLTGRAVDGSTPARDMHGDPVPARWFGQSSFATHSIVTARNAVKVDKDLPLERLGPLGCGIQTGAGSVLIALDVKPGSSLVVFGAGAVGLSAVMAAKVAGAETILVVDINPDRLQLATSFGATGTFDGAQEGLLEALLEAAPGGVGYALDTTGVPQVATTALTALRPTGVCALVGAPRGDLVLPANLLGRGRTVTGVLEGSAVPQQFIPRMIELWRAGRFPFDELITTFPLEKISEAEQAAERGEVVKPVLLPEKSTTM